MALDLAFFRARLIEERNALLDADRRAETDRAPVTLDQESVGRLSRMDALQVQAMAEAQARRRLAARQAIAAALRRIDEGEYGYCVTCGEDIAEARLLNSPEAPTCIGCARRSQSA